MAQLPYIGLYKPCSNLPFGDCAMYFDYGVKQKMIFSLLLYGLYCRGCLMQKVMYFSNLIQIPCNFDLYTI